MARALRAVWSIGIITGVLNSVPGWWTYGFFHVIRDRIHAYLRVSSSSSFSSSPSSSSSSSSSECSTSSTSSTSSADPWSAGFDWSVCTRRELETAAGHLSAAIKALQHLFTRRSAPGGFLYGVINSGWPGKKTAFASGCNRIWYIFSHSWCEDVYSLVLGSLIITLIVPRG